MNIKTRKITVIGMLSAISIILGSTPLGFIPIPPVGATIMHLPVIIGAILEGPVAGSFVGLFFGIFSMIHAVVAPTSPVQIVFLNPFVSVLPRVLIAITSYYAYLLLGKFFKSSKSDFLNISIASFIGSATNTIGVLSMIYLTEATKFAALSKISIKAVKGILLSVGIANGIPEAIVAVVIATAVVKIVKKFQKNRL